MNCPNVRDWELLSMGLLTDQRQQMMQRMAGQRTGGQRAAGQRTGQQRAGQRAAGQQRAGQRGGQRRGGSGQQVPIYRLMKKTNLKGVLVKPFNEFDRVRYIK